VLGFSWIDFALLLFALIVTLAVERGAYRSCFRLVSTPEPSVFISRIVELSGEAVPDPVLDCARACSNAFVWCKYSGA